MVKVFSAGIGLRDRGNAPGRSLSGGNEEEPVWKDPRINVAGCWDSILDLYGLIFHKTTLKTIHKIYAPRMPCKKFIYQGIRGAWLFPRREVISLYARQRQL